MGGTGRGGDGWRRAGKWALRLVLTVAVTWAVLDRVGVSVEALRGLDRRWLAPSALPLAGGTLLLLVGYVASATFWGLLVRDLGGGHLGFVEANRIYFTANLGRYLPGKVWQIGGLAYLARGAGVPPLTATAAAVLGQGMTLVGAFVVGLGALGALGPRWTALLPWVVAALVGVSAVLAVPGLFRRFVRGVFRLAGREPPDPEGLDALFGLRWLVLYAGNWLLYAAGFWLLARSYGLDGGFVATGGAFAAAYLLGYLAVFAPAGVGVREGILAGLVAPWATPEAGLALAVVARVWTTAAELVPVAAFGGGYLMRRGKGGAG